jgi:hypothetical protein
VRRVRGAAVLGLCAWLGGCAAVEVSEDPEGLVPSALEVHPPRAVLLPARLDGAGRPVATRMAWIPDERSPGRFALRPGGGTARLRLDLRDEDGWVGWLTRYEAGADARVPGAVAAAGDLAEAAVVAASAAAGAGR